MALKHECVHLGPQVLIGQSSSVLILTVQRHFQWPIYITMIYRTYRIQIIQIIYIIVVHIYIYKNIYKKDNIPEGTIIFFQLLESGVAMTLGYV